MLVSDFVVLLNVILSVCWPGCEGVCVCWTYVSKCIHIHGGRVYSKGQNVRRAQHNLMLSCYLEEEMYESA